jgi:hypothetical protein
LGKSIFLLRIAIYEEKDIQAKVIASAHKKGQMSLPSGLNAKNSIFGYTKIVLIASGLFCICARIEYVNY